MDLFLALIAVTLVWSLNLDLRKRLGLSAVLGAGVLYLCPLFILSC